MFYVGLMSGTSLDGIDVALAEFSGQTGKLLDFITLPFPASLRTQLTELCTPSPDEIDKAGQASAQLAITYADAVKHIIQRNQLTTGQIRAIGCHGQTVRHRPDSGYPFTLQLVDASRLAVLTQVDVVSDFRSKDIALGGQGAPLAPGFHAAQFSDYVNNKDVVIVNIGGIANLTVLHNDKSKPIIGFDSGPGNGLMDAWAQLQFDKSYDDNGNLARSGSVSTELLNACLADPYFSLPAPKSTGRERFNLPWLQQVLSSLDDQPSHEDVMATLVELTAISIVNAIEQFSTSRHVFVCGGGAYNGFLMSRLSAILGEDVRSTQALGLSPDAVEAIAFAWLAHVHLSKQPGNIPSVTGASKPAILGTLTPWQ